MTITTEEFVAWCEDWASRNEQIAAILEAKSEAKADALEGMRFGKRDIDKLVHECMDMGRMTGQSVSLEGLAKQLRKVARHVEQGGRLG